MVVVAPTMRVGVRRSVTTIDRYGTPRSGGHGPLETPRPARVISEPATDANLDTGPGRWVLAVDPAFWPLYPGDLLVEETGDGRKWTVVSAAIRGNQWNPVVSYVRVEATLDQSDDQNG